MQGERLRLIVEVRERILSVGRRAIWWSSHLSSGCRSIEIVISGHGCQLRGLILVIVSILTIRGSAFGNQPRKVQQVA